MGYYKVPQDVEAEDKLLGPFTFKQFIFIIATVVSGFVAFQLTVVNFFIALPLYPVVMVFALLGFYRPKDQPVENKVLAYLNFWLKPRKRTWSRDGIIEHVKIKVPKKVEVSRTDTRSQDQVRSQLKELAQIVDTRGWASKRAALQLPSHIDALDTDDRLIQPKEVTVTNTQPEIDDAVDIYDQTNATNQHIGQLSVQAEEQARRQILDQLNARTEPIENDPSIRQKAHELAEKSKEEPKIKLHGSKGGDYVNPYKEDNKQSKADAKKAAEQQAVQEEARQRVLKELQQNEGATISSIASKAAEITIDHSQPNAGGGSELQIEHQ